MCELFSLNIFEYVCCDILVFAFASKNSWQRLKTLRECCRQSTCQTCIVFGGIAQYFRRHLRFDYDANDNANENNIVLSNIISHNHNKVL